MEKKFGNEEDLNRLLDEQFAREAQMLERALLSGTNMEDYQESDEKVRGSYEKLVRRLKDEGIYREEEAGQEHGAAGNGGEGRPFAAPEKKKSGSRTRGSVPWGRVGRIAGFVLVCVIGVFAVSMTSEANRRYVVEGIRYWTGKEARITVSNDEENDRRDEDEYGAISGIEEELQIEVPEFCYRPAAFDYKAYGVHKEAGTAWIEYICGSEENIVTFYISRIDENTASAIDSVHGEEFETIVSDREGIEMRIEQIEDEGPDQPSYYVRWERNGALYEIAGRIELEELKKLLQNIVY